MKPKIITLTEMKKIVLSLDLMSAIESGFTSYSANRAVVPPVGELILDKGEVHIKYGYIKNEDFYVVKIASGFYGNPDIGLPCGDGLMLLFKQETGELVSILLDEGYLTDIRTGIAGAIAAKYLAPKNVQRIGIVGTGVQARFQLSSLCHVTDCKDVLVSGLNEQFLQSYKADMEKLGYQIETTLDTSQILPSCNLIVTTTPSKEPLLFAKDLRKGVHITAMGSDTQEKQELDSQILKKADVVVADSISQCLVRGEIHKALEANLIKPENLIELGDVISGQVAGRMSDEQITVADLTGVAVQDIKIAEAVYNFS